MSEKKMVNFQPEWVATFTGIYSILFFFIFVVKIEISDMDYVDS